MTRKLLATLLLLPSIAMSQATTERPSPIKGTGEEDVVDRHEAEAMATDAFLNTHLDLKYLLIGRKAFLEGKFASAITAFERSAFYGDKLAQASLAEMYWEGKGVPVDRVRAYAMADVAAERLNNVFLVSLRERYWNTLTPAEREQVAILAPQILERYSQEHTGKRVAQMFRNSQNSRRAKGYGRMLHNIVLYNHSTGGIIDDIKPEAFFAEKFWDSERYQQFKDKYVEAATKSGTVSVRFGGETQTSRVSSDGNAKPDPDDEKRDDDN